MGINPKSLDLKQYFPDMKVCEIQERDFMFKILSTLRIKEIQTLIKEAIKQKSIANKSENYDLI